MFTCDITSNFKEIFCKNLLIKTSSVISYLIHHRNSSEIFPKDSAFAYRSKPSSVQKGNIRINKTCWHFKLEFYDKSILL